jgi:hypothetical protein
VTENRTLLIVVIALAFITGVAVGVAGTLLTTRQGGTPGTATVAGTGGTVATPAAPGGAVTTTRPNAQGGATQGTGVFINEKQVAQTQLDELRQIYGAAPPPGHYWYDPRSGLYGNWGYEAAGYIRPGHDFGAVPTEASRGNTGVFINGRQLNMNEAMYLQRTFGAVYQGRWWLDGQTGNFGQEGNSMPLGNLVAALQAAQRSNGGGGGAGGGYRWRDQINHSNGGAENGCVWVSTPGSTYMSSGCN